MATTKQITDRYSITQYWAGKDIGKRLQITDNNTIVYSDNAYIQGISPDDAKAIGNALIDWSRNGLT
jgi:hypothetical protein